MNSILRVKCCRTLILMILLAMPWCFAFTQTSYGTNAGTQGDGIYLGQYAGQFTARFGNSFVGHASGYTDEIGYNNTFLGQNTGKWMLEGERNVFIGINSGLNSYSGYNNVFMGSFAGKNSNGSNSTFIGHYAGFSDTLGFYNTYVGRKAAYSCEKGDRNTYLGMNTGSTMNEGFGNILIGYEAGKNISSGDDLLYISNNSSNLPLIHGMFDISRLVLNGSVGIGCSDPDAKLTVNGNIKSTGLFITNDVPNSDHVFEDGYNLRSLGEVEEFITNNKHLPEIPSAAEFESNGYSIGTMDDLLLRKIEELTLYIIEQQKELKELEQKLVSKTTSHKVKN